MSAVVYLNGWPGSGKLTVGRLLAHRLKARLLDNHTTLNPAEALFERRDPLHASLRRAVRDVTLEHAALLPTGTSLVVTDPLADDEHDRAEFNRFAALADLRGVPLATVVLDVDLEENLRRLCEPGRAERLKLTRPETLCMLRARHTLLRPTRGPRLDLDITRLAPDDAATQIETWLLRSLVAAHPHD